VHLGKLDLPTKIQKLPYTKVVLHTVAAPRLGAHPLSILKAFVYETTLLIGSALNLSTTQFQEQSGRAAYVHKNPGTCRENEVLLEVLG
jgi:hypothetical protein